jgi:hypothetical protein
MTNTALDALKKIQALRKYDVPQAPLAERKILSNLNLTDLASVVNALEAQTTTTATPQPNANTGTGSVTRG